MKKIPLFLISFLFLQNFAFAQRASGEAKTYEYPRLRIGVEAGVESIFGSNVKPDAIRESQSYYRYGYDGYRDYYYDCGYLYNQSSFDRIYFGIKPEYSLNHNFAVSAGLRFGFGGNSLTSDRDNFLWRVSETETSTNYLRIKSITQNVYNLGIPLEFKIFPNKSDIFWRLYGTVGMLFNFAFAEDVSVNFIDEKMNKYLPEVKNQFEKPDFFNGQFVLGFGMKIGRMRNPFGTVEFQMPYQLSDRTRFNSLFEMESIVGVCLKTTIYIPVGKQQLSYIYYR
jgi:hypothetical protein